MMMLFVGRLDSRLQFIDVWAEALLAVLFGNRERMVVNLVCGGLMLLRYLYVMILPLYLLIQLLKDIVVVLV